MPVTEGYVLTDDSVRLYYRSVGDGRETVVVPMALYLEGLLAPLARSSRLCSARSTAGTGPTSSRASISRGS
jgi:hypothetical protein